MPQSNKKTHDTAFNQANRGAHPVSESKEPESTKEPEPSSSEDASTESKDAESSEEDKKVRTHLGTALDALTYGTG